MARQAVTKGVVGKAVPWTLLQEVMFDDFLGKKLSYEGFTIEKFGRSFSWLAENEFERALCSLGSTVTDETLRKLRLLIPTTPAPPPRPLQIENMLVRFWKKVASEYQKARPNHRPCSYPSPAPSSRRVQLLLDVRINHLFNPLSYCFAGVGVLSCDTKTPRREDKWKKDK